MTSKAELDQMVSANLVLQQTIMERLMKARQADAKAKVALERAALNASQEEEFLARLYQMKVYDTVTAPEWEEVKVDPRTGEMSDKWAEIVVERVLQKDEEWADKLGKAHKAQEAHTEARSACHQTKAKVDNMMDQLTTARSQASTTAAWLRFLAGEDE